MTELVKEVFGDIFTYDGGIICHGCNTQGLMGKGLALKMKNKFPDMYTKYKNLCADNILEPGDVYEYKDNKNYRIKYVFNLMTQDNLKSASLDYIEKSLEKAIRLAKSYGYNEFAIPLLGCGLGNLKWMDVKKIVLKLAKEYNFKIVVYI